MPKPGRVGTNRLIAHQRGYRRMGACPPLAFVGGGPSFAASLSISISGIAFNSLSPLLADGLGRMPVVLSDPNVSGNLPLDDSAGPTRWSGWIGGTVNSGGCESGQSNGVFAIVVPMLNPSFYTVRVYVLCKLPDGSCTTPLIFCGGGFALPGVVAGTPEAVSNRAAAGQALSGILAAPSGTAVVGAS